MPSSELKQVQHAMKQTKDKRMFERYQTISLYLQGYTYAQIREVIGRSERTIGLYVKSYRANGLESLIRKASPGAPHKLSPEQEAQLVHVIVHAVPADVGFRARHNWTLSLITAYVKREWDKEFTLRGMSRLLKSLGLSYSKATYTLEKADEQKQNEFREHTFPTLKKTDF